MRVYLGKNVVDAALDRYRWIFDEFPHVLVNVSGGKDSTIVLNLALRVAEEKGRLPLRVLFVDQEAEWACAISHVREIMDDPRVEPAWLQVPIQLFNSTSPYSPWLKCWEPGQRWMRDKEEDSLHENVYGTVTFAEMFGAVIDHDYPDEPACLIAGVRAEESPARALGLTTYPCYKHVTWGSKNSGKRDDHVTFYPIYDWSVRDVWKAIDEHGWPYCSLYDELYRYGVPTRQMRLSNLHHETAVRSLFYLQEIEPDTWDALTERLTGINATGHLSMASLRPEKLPPMFKDWIEYRDHLLDTLVVEDDKREAMRNQFLGMDRRFDHDPKVFANLVQTEISAILVNDYHTTKLRTFEAANLGKSKNRGKISGRRFEDANTGLRSAG